MTGLIILFSKSKEWVKDIVSVSITTFVNLIYFKQNSTFVFLRNKHIMANKIQKKTGNIWTGGKHDREAERGFTAAEIIKYISSLMKHIASVNISDESIYEAIERGVNCGILRQTGNRYSLILSPVSTNIVANKNCAEARSLVRAVLRLLETPSSTEQTSCKNNSSSYKRSNFNDPLNSISRKRNRENRKKKISSHHRGNPSRCDRKKRNPNLRSRNRTRRGLKNVRCSPHWRRRITRCGRQKKSCSPLRRKHTTGIGRQMRICSPLRERNATRSRRQRRSRSPLRRRNGTGCWRETATR